MASLLFEMSCVVVDGVVTEDDVSGRMRLRKVEDSSVLISESIDYSNEF